MRNEPRRRCVLLFARSPEQEGKLKSSRGVPGGSALFRFARSRVADAVGALAGVDLVLIGGGPAPDGAVGALPQRGASFAERLQNAFRDVRALGYEQVVAVPSDVPSLDQTFLAEAFAALETHRVVLGPCIDGGVFLIGSNGASGCNGGDGFDDALLLRVRWRTRFVGRDLVRNAAGSAHLLPALHDVDDAHGYAALSAARHELDSALANLIARLGDAPLPRNEWIRCSESGPSLGAPSARGPPS